MLILRLLKFALKHSKVIPVPIVSILAILTLIVESVAFALKLKEFVIMPGQFIKVS